MRVVPVGDKVVVRRMDTEEKTPAGIVLPEAAREKQQVGRVLSIGDGKRLPNGTHAPVSVTEGDRVLFSTYAGTEVDVDGQKLLVMGEDDILAVVR